MYAFVVLLSVFLFSYIDRVSKLHVPTSTRKGAQTECKIDFCACFLLCCTDLKDYLEHCMIDGDKLGM